MLSWARLSRADASNSTSELVLWTHFWADMMLENAMHLRGTRVISRVKQWMMLFCACNAWSPNSPLEVRCCPYSSGNTSTIPRSDARKWPAFIRNVPNTNVLRRRRSIETKAAKTQISNSPPPQPLPPPPPPPNNDDDNATPGVSLQTHAFKQAFDICFRECARQRRPTFIAGEPGNMATLFGWDKLIEQRFWRSNLTKKLIRHCKRTTKNLR